jgi:glycosyltransferase involved in cell wall biosynthesis
LHGDAPLVGLITSGDFQKRGLDRFVRCAELVAAERADARFLVVGSKSLPDSVRAHPLATSGRLLHRPKSRDPERWFAALDVFLYPALFEEFGMVVSEAQAMGLPIVTSRMVGATECLAPVYERWLAARPDAEVLSRHVLELLASGEARHELAAAGIASSRACDDRAYARASVATILLQKRRLK